MPESDQLLTPKQAAEFLAVRPQTLATWRCTKRKSIPFTKDGTFIRYRKSDLERWLEERRVQPAA